VRVSVCLIDPGADWGEKVARSDRPTQYTARCPLNASHVSTSQWPTWKNAHTLNIILDDYKEITSYMFFFLNNIWIHQFAWVDTWNKMILAIITLQGRYGV